MRAPVSRILVIKLGALGDFVQATGAFQDIRNHYPQAHITLMTTPGLLPFASPAPFFNAIVTDPRRPFWQLGNLFDVLKRMRGYDLIIDLQNNQRTMLYYYLLGRPRWAGSIKGCTYEQLQENHRGLHTLDRLGDLLSKVGIASQHLPDVRFARHDASDKLAAAGLEDGKYVVLIPGGSAHRPEKRWTQFEHLARRIIDGGTPCVLVGGGAEADILHQIAALTGAVNFCNQTTLNQLVDVCANAKAFVGNDTGPAHIAAACGVPGVVLFGHASDPNRCAPRGRNIHILQKDNIDDISVDDIVTQLPLLSGGRS